MWWNNSDMCRRQTLHQNIVRQFDFNILDANHHESTKPKTPSMLLPWLVNSPPYLFILEPFLHPSLFSRPAAASGCPFKISFAVKKTPSPPPKKPIERVEADVGASQKLNLRLMWRLHLYHSSFISELLSLALFNVRWDHSFIFICFIYVCKCTYLMCFVVNIQNFTGVP